MYNSIIETWNEDIKISTIPSNELIDDTVYLAKYWDSYVLIIKNTKNNNLPTWFAINDNISWWRILWSAIPDESLSSDIIPLKNTERVTEQETYPSKVSKFDTMKYWDNIYLSMKYKNNNQYFTEIKKYTISTNTLENFLYTGDIITLYDRQKDFILSHIWERDNIDTIPPYDVLMIHEKTKEMINLGKVIDISIDEYLHNVSYTRLSIYDPSESCNNACHIWNNKLIYFIRQREQRYIYQKLE